MSKKSLEELVRGSILSSKKKYTLLGIGPMSTNLIYASLELAKEKKFPVMYIASRNQVDADEFGSGYVNNWDAKRFVNSIKKIADGLEFNGEYFICRDHGGPWQRDLERSSKLPRKEALDIAKKSYFYDIEAGFNLLHIDPTKIPDCGDVAPMEDVLEMTVELIRYCEMKRLELQKDTIFYEVGTEETNGGLTDVDNFEKFIQELFRKLDNENLPHPLFIVGQTGTLVRMTENVGYFNSEEAKKLVEIVSKFKIGLKEHNCDYISIKDLCLHPVVGVTASNVAPEFGYNETRALLDLFYVENKAVQLGLLKESSNFYNVILEETIKCDRWKKWLLKPLKEEDIKSDTEMSKQILFLAGHYTFNNLAVKEQVKIMYHNLEKCGIDPRKYVIERLKENLNKYVIAFNLEGTLNC